MSRQQEVVKLLAPYLVAFPSNKMNDAGLMIYGRTLADFDLVEIEAAMNKLMLTARFFPTIAEIVEQIRNIKSYAAASNGGKQELSAADAWEEAMKNVRTHHVYSPWTYSTEALKQTCKQFGITELCSLESDSVNTARAQFMRMYESNISRVKDNAVNKKVIDRLGAAKVQQLMEGAVKMIS